MKNIIMKITLAAAMAAGTSVAAMYPPQKGDMAASIPFSFQAGGKIMAPGEYLIRANENGTIEICEDGVYCATLRETMIPSTGQRTRLLFAGSGSQRQMLGVVDDSEQKVTSGRTTVPMRPLHIDHLAGTGLPTAWW